MTGTEIWIIIGLAYFTHLEVNAVTRDGINYVKDIWNFVNLASLSLNLCLMINDLLQFHYLENDAITFYTFLAVLLMWFQLIYWFRLFGSTSFYIKLIFKTVSDIALFTIIFVIILMGFANGLYVLNSRKHQGYELYEHAFESDAKNALLS